MFSTTFDFIAIRKNISTNTDPIDSIQIAMDKYENSKMFWHFSEEVGVSITCFMSTNCTFVKKNTF